jgi:hypothetical protein
MKFFRAPWMAHEHNILAMGILQLTVAGIRSMAEANRAERHAWVERAAQRAEPQAALSN